MSLLKSLVLSDVVEIVPANHQRSLHLHTLHNAREDSATDGDIASEGTLLVNVRALDCLQETSISHFYTFEKHSEK